MLSRFPSERTRRSRLGLGMAFLASAVLAGLLAAPPSAAKDDDHRDELQHKKSTIESKISDHKDNVVEISGRLVQAQKKVKSAEADLAAARKKLADLQEQVKKAKARDEQMQHKLDLAKQRLADARADLARGKRQVVDQRADLAGYVADNYQGRGLGLSSVGLALSSHGAQQMVDRMVATDAAINKQRTRLQKYKATRVLLTLTEQRVQQTKEKVAAARQQAAEHLKKTQDLEKQAAAAKDRVAKRVETLRAKQQDLAHQKEKEKHRIDVLKRERAKVEKKLKKIAAARARARKRRERREARQEARREREQQQKEKQQQVAASSSEPAAEPAGPNSEFDDGGYLSMPVHIPTYITSPYGRRFHPIVHEWRLHDGTDLHAPCGTPIYAAAPGTVTQEYYNSAYGNRLFIDHGVVNGVSLTTSYQHLSSYVASVGEHVDRGELIAYAGGTGWVTACHLHFMVFVNGATVNPMTWL